MFALAALLLTTDAGGSQADRVAPAMVSEADPVALFYKVCLADGVALAPKAFAPARYSELPKDAQEALNFAFPSRSGPQIRPGSTIDPATMPNAFVVSLPGRRTYVMLPAPAGSAGVTASACAVIW